MAQARIDEDGNLVDAETGEMLGNVREGINFNANGPRYTLEEMGAEMPEEPDEEELKKIREKYFGETPVEKRNEQESSLDDSNEKEVKDAHKTNENSTAGESSMESHSHIDKGPSSFQVNRTKYEVTKDSFFIIRFGLVQKEDDRFVVTSYESALDNYESELHWVKFRMWNYDEELKWKADCLEYNSQLKGQILNIDKLNERKLRMLILDWSFGEYEDRLKLLHCDGKLSDESYSILKGMYPSIINAIINMMNNVLENNQ